MNDFLYILFALSFSALALAELGVAVKGKEWRDEKRDMVLILHLLVVAVGTVWVILYTQVR